MISEIISVETNQKEAAIISFTALQVKQDGNVICLFGENGILAATIILHESHRVILAQ